MSAADVQTERGLDRVIFFSDAVVAIAITLLILPVVESAREATSARELISNDGSQLVGFVVSFLVIAQFWVAHHHMFERVRRYTPLLVWLNMFWLMSIAFLPVPSEMLGSAGPDEEGVRFLYLASMTVISALLLLISLVIQRTPSVRGGEPADLSVISGAVTCAAFLAATIIGTLVPSIGLWALLLLAGAGPLGARLEAKQAVRAAG